jgi:hypothetical protein
VFFEWSHTRSVFGTTKIISWVKAIESEGEIKDLYNVERGTKGVKQGRKRKKLGVRQRELVTTERPLEKR